MRLLMLLLLTAVLAGPPEAESCGTLLSVAQFSYVATPPPGVFARGQLGILRPHYYRRYLVVAFRYLTGVPLSREEAVAFDERRVSIPASLAPPSPIDQWTGARNQVLVVPAIRTIDPFRRLKGSTPWVESYLNCLDDAFVHAAETLRERAARWGANSSLTAEWVRGQDAVFKNCSGGEEIPPAAPSTAEALLKADRQYQIAAAEFYSEQYDAAERDFGALARDANSPWQDLGDLMLARSLIRHATVAEATGKLTEAQRVLDAIISNPQRPKWHGAAEKLKDLVAARLDPEGQLQNLSERLTRVESGPEFAHALTDFTVLCDKQNAATPGGPELADWIATFQAVNWEHALEQWRMKPNDAWLIAALASVPHDNPAVPELLAAAQRVPHSAPAWASAAFYGTNLERKRGENDAARRWAGQALTTNPSPDVRNEFLAQRLALAPNWEEFLRYGPRQPVAMGWDVRPDEPLEYGRPERNPRKNLFDSDFTVPLNHAVPLERWVDASSDKLLPADLQVDIAQSGWVRAVLLDRIPLAQALATRLAQLRPQFRTSLQTWAAEKDPQSARFQAVLFMLRTPGLQPVVRDNFGRETPAGKIDDFRDNWWDLSDPVSYPGTPPRSPEAPPGFLSKPERAAGQQEWQRLQKEALRAPDYLCHETVLWARAHPDDPRVPEALHLAVRTTRYTNGAHTTTFPKQAFVLLHTKYPKSPWAAATPYWY